jgi:hypothetical protein
MAGDTILKGPVQATTNPESNKEGTVDPTGWGLDAARFEAWSHNKGGLAKAGGSVAESVGDSDTEAKIKQPHIAETTKQDHATQLAETTKQDHATQLAETKPKGGQISPHVTILRGGQPGPNPEGVTILKGR